MDTRNRARVPKKRGAANATARSRYFRLFLPFFSPYQANYSRNPGHVRTQKQEARGGEFPWHASVGARQARRTGNQATRTLHGDVARPAGDAGESAIYMAEAGRHFECERELRASVAASALLKRTARRRTRGESGGASQFG